MKNFPRFLATISAFCALSTAILAQSIEKRINDDSYFGASVYRPYVFPEIKDTPAPKGFKPFYISHFGRHGSRHQADNNATRAYTILKKADKAGILSPRGKELYADISTLVEDHEGQMGHLSPKGAAEHRTLARRMKARFPSVFKIESSYFDVDTGSPLEQPFILAYLGLDTKIPGVPEEGKGQIRRMGQYCQG